MAPLDTYKAKRNFRKTSEPSGARKRRVSSAPATAGIFVIHKHAARRLHYDLRLEHGGVLWSWAVTRGPSLDPLDRRLAVHVEDHPLDYASFEGNIPKGEYGGGAVIVWDEGTWIPDGDPAAALQKGHIQFELKGNKLNGSWHLVRLKPHPGEKADNWLLIKSDDAFARPGEDILADAPQSVKSGRTIEQIAGDVPAPKVTSATAGSPKAPIEKTNSPRQDKTRRGATMPGFIAPALATLSATPPSGAQWLHEVKFDGYRMQAHVQDGTIVLYTRSGIDWSERFGEQIASALRGLDCNEAIIDGEIVVLAENGVASFSRLQIALTERHTELMTFYAFDLLYLDGEDKRDEPLVERKERLRALLGQSKRDAALLYSEHFSESGQTMLQHACRMGLEGIVSKRADAPYQSGRGNAWIKSKCTLRREFVIGGYLPSEKTGRGLRSLLVGFHHDGKLRYAGRVGTGFSTRGADDLKRRLDRLAAPKSPFGDEVPEAGKVVWVAPQLVAEIEFRAWTSDRILRQASFQGLREDKPAEEVVEEVESTADQPQPEPRSKKGPAPMPTAIELSNPGKLLWPQEKVSKKDLLDHYERVWPRMKPFVVGRPLALLRAPDGIGKQHFFQKHASPGMHEAIRTMADPQDGEELLYIDDFDGLAALVQLGVVEVHVWGATVDAIETPDQIVFDLDPDEGLGVEPVRAAALDLRRRLDELGFSNFVKTSGGKGFHVVVPLKPKANWTGVKTFAHDFAHAMEQLEPKLYTATLSKMARKGRIFIDYLRNGRGSTTVAPYSSRARKGATVSMPVAWQRVEGTLAPADFSVGGKALSALLKEPDPWADFFQSGKQLARD